MGIERYFGFHFAGNCIYISEAYVDRDDHLSWDIIEQANYELEPEWLPLFKDAIPSLRDNDAQVYGFDAIPDDWTHIRDGRFLYFNTRFFEETVSGRNVERLVHLFRYCRTYHIRAHPDESLVATVVIEGLSRQRRTALRSLLSRISASARLGFVDVIDPEEACLRYLWYESLRRGLNVENKFVLLVYLGYTRTLMIPWNHCQMPGHSVVAPGMVEIDRDVITYVKQMGIETKIGMEDLLLYAQRARRAFDKRQPFVEMMGAEVESRVYAEIIQDRVSDIIGRLRWYLDAQGDGGTSVDEVILVGEGADATPVVEAIQTAHLNIPLNFLPHPVYSVAMGAASKSWSARNPDSEVR